MFQSMKQVWKRGNNYVNDCLLSLRQLSRHCTELWNNRLVSILCLPYYRCMNIQYITQFWKYELIGITIYKIKINSLNLQLLYTECVVVILNVSNLKCIHYQALVLTDISYWQVGLWRCICFPLKASVFGWLRKR